MRAVDTNVLVRIIAQDDANQLRAAERFISSGAWVSHLVLAETVWVLAAIYGRKPAEVAAAVETLLGHETLTIEDPDVVGAALAQFRARPTLKFSDCLILEIARKAGHVPIGTFDKDLAKLSGVERVQA
jgi:predicted nucleic-acid-binding protein